MAGPGPRPGPGPRHGPPGGPPGSMPPEKPKDLKASWGRMFGYSKRYWPIMALSVVFSSISVVIMLFGPNKISELTGLIAEGMLSGIDIAAVKGIAVFMGCLYLGSAALSVFQQLISTYVSQNLSKSLRGDISRKINRLPMGFFNETSTGDLLSRVTNDVDTIAQSLSQSLGSLVASLTFFLGSIIMMLVTDGLLTLTAIAASLLGFVLMGVISGKGRKFFMKQQQNLGLIGGHIEEMYTGHTVIKAYNGEDAAIAEFDRLNDNLRGSGFMAQCFGGLMPPLMGFVGNLGYVAVCVVGSVLTIRGRIGFEVIVAFMMYVRYFTQPLSQLAQVAQSLMSAAAAGERVFEFLEAREMEDESEKPATASETLGSVEFRNVRFGYEGSDRIVIKDFSAKAEPGQKIAIVGPTGAGKTTLVNLLMRFHEINGGEILIDGVSTRDMKREEVRRKFCMVLQDTWLFEGTVWDNLVYSTEGVTKEDVDRACRAVGLHHFIRTLPSGYDTVLSDKVTLSGGQKQQFTIARAMIADRPMLILDEATSSIDTRTEHRIQRAMDELMQGRTSFVIAHRLSTIRNADLILVMRDGDIVESGKHEELLAAGGFYAELWTSQFDTVS